MWIQTFFKSLISTPTRRRPVRRRSPVSRLSVEALEDRCLLSFSPAASYPVGLDPRAVVTADFNGDSRLDLAVANAGSNTVSVLLGNGDGTFQAARNSSTGSGPRSLLSGDLNGDGKTDLVTLNDSSLTGSVADLTLLLGNGDGTFQPPQTVVLPRQLPPGYTGTNPLDQSARSVALGDLNGDGKLDLVATGSTEYDVVVGYDDYGNPIYDAHIDAYVNVLPGNGDGSFGPGIAYHDNHAGNHVELGDFNSDGRLDVAFDDGGGALSVQLGNGDATLQAVQRSYVGDWFGTIPNPVGDFDRDGKLDLLMVDGTGNALLLMRGNGDGTFQSAQQVYVGTNHATVVGDVNGDGKLDMVVLSSNYDDHNVWSSSAQMLLGNGDGSFAAPIPSDLGIPPDNYFSSAVLADFEGDGRPELAAPWAQFVDNYTDQGSVAVAHNDGIWPTPQASRFAVSSFPSPGVAGAAGSFTVTAKNVDGTTATGYTATVHFRSSDSQADIPADYTFTAADQGVHTFSATLKTAGTQSITAIDTVFTNITGTQSGISVNPAAASIMTVAGFPSPVTAGVASNFTVTLRDAYGNIASGYTGTVDFTSSDGKAALPANYTFTAADTGVHTFSATLKTAGIESITAADIAAPGLTGTEGGITVKPAAARQFVISAPSSVSAGVAFSLTLTVKDAYGNVVTGYTGTIHFTSTDRRATLPKNYTFTAADKGVHTFTGLVLRNKGKQTITVTDTLNSSLTASVIENVL